MSLPPLKLPPEITSRAVEGVNGLSVHLLEAGEADRPVVVLLHGFPELAYSWRAVMPALAAAGYRVIAPDARGHGRTTGGDTRYDGDTAQYRQMNVLTDLVALLDALDVRTTAGVVGHDMGAQFAGYAALVRPDLFPRVAMMSAPFAGPPPVGGGAPRRNLDAALAALPRPRRHYTHYYSGPEAAGDMDAPPQGLHDFLRAYFHVKSGDWDGNAPQPLGGADAEHFAKLPTYYVMDRGVGMPATVAPFMPTPAEVAACRWLTDADLAVYAAEYGRAGFQPALNWYRVRTDAAHMAELRVFAGRRIDVPACFIAGAKDWGIHQSPGALDAMRTRACADFRGLHLIEGAGHWVQQEAADEVAELLVAFLRSA